MDILCKTFVLLCGAFSLHNRSWTNLFGLMTGNLHSIYIIYNSMSQYLSMSETNGGSCNLGSCTEKPVAMPPTKTPYAKVKKTIAPTSTSTVDTTLPILFWSQDPNVLFQPAHILEFFPTETMTYNQKLNAITRTVIVLTLISFLFTRNTRLLGIAVFTLLAIYLLYFAHQRATPSLTVKQEPFDLGSNKNTTPSSPFRGGGKFTGDTNIAIPGDQSRKAVLHAGFLPTTSDNPLGNVLVTEYEFDPTRPPAQPAYNETVSNDILQKTKQMIARNNPGQPDIVDKLFGDLGDEFVFEQSMQPFYATANTMIPNDQAGFAQFCYGSMVSCKEGDRFACGRNGPPRYQQ